MKYVLFLFFALIVAISFVSSADIQNDLSITSIHSSVYERVGLVNNYKYYVGDNNITCEIFNNGNQILLLNSTIGVKLSVTGSSYSNTYTKSLTSMAANTDTKVTFTGVNFPSEQSYSLKCEATYSRDTATENNSKTISISATSRSAEPTSFDLSIEDILGNAQTINFGQANPISCALKNNSASSSSYSVSLSVTGPNGFTYSSSASTGTIAANNSTNIPFTFTPQSSNGYGSYTFTCKLNTSDSDLSNNTKTATITYADPNKPDLDVTIDGPSDYESGDSVDIRCTHTNIGGSDARGRYKMELYVNGTREGTEEYNDTLSRQDFIDTDFTYDVEDDEDGTLDFECRLTYTPYSSQYNEDNTSNNKATLSLSGNDSVERDAVYLKIRDVDVTDEADLGERINVRCNYKNYGRTSTREEDSIKVYLYIDNDRIESENVDEVLSSGETGHVDFDYTIPNYYNDDQMEIGCKIEYSPDRETSLRRDQDDEDSTKIDITNDTYVSNYTSAVDLIAQKPFFDKTYGIKGQSGKLTCRVQNAGSISAQLPFQVYVYKDGSIINTSQLINDDIPSYGYYDYPYILTLDSTGSYSYKCFVKYYGSDNTGNNTSSDAVFTVYDKDPSTNGSSVTYRPVSGNSNSTTTQTTNKGVQIVQVNSVSVSNVSGSKADILCNYTNVGSMDIPSYNLSITLNNLVKDNINITENLKQNDNKTYTSSIDISGQSGALGCIVTLDSGKSFANYTTLQESSSFASYLLVGIILLILGLIVFLVIKFR